MKLPSLYVWFLHLHFGNGNSENPVFHRSLNLIHLCILWLPEPPQELATAALHPVPGVVSHSVVFNFSLHFLLLEPREIRLEHVGFWVSFQSTRELTKAGFSLAN
ncbi:hypothetical protein I3842_13G083800 [Carya illinoinensis]|uniref:Uncharacterized protein n=1 Tax=Carya illinoinensis TaxID=32201 RepID=A0A922AP30_CARIL|nr:hypothetical protein I3842_13G083800 [Carya illinoinensis]